MGFSGLLKENNNTVFALSSFSIEVLTNIYSFLLTVLTNFNSVVNQIVVHVIIFNFIPHIFLSAFHLSNFSFSYHLLVMLHLISTGKF
jgi:hypothetical protein